MFHLPSLLVVVSTTVATTSSRNQEKTSYLFKENLFKKIDPKRFMENLHSALLTFLESPAAVVMTPQPQTRTPRITRLTSEMVGKVQKSKAHKWQCTMGQKFKKPTKFSKSSLSSNSCLKQQAHPISINWLKEK